MIVSITIFGTKEVGEGATTPTLGCLSNAIYDAIGIQIKSLPISYEKIWRALKENKEKEKSESCCCCCEKK